MLSAADPQKRIICIKKVAEDLCMVAAGSLRAHKAAIEKQDRATERCSGGFPRCTELLFFCFVGAVLGLLVSHLFELITPVE